MYVRGLLRSILWSIIMPLLPCPQFTAPGGERPGALLLTHSKREEEAALLPLLKRVEQQGAPHRVVWCWRWLCGGKTCFHPHHLQGGSWHLKRLLMPQLRCCARQQRVCWTKRFEAPAAVGLHVLDVSCAMLHAVGQRNARLAVLFHRNHVGVWAGRCRGKRGGGGARQHEAWDQEATVHWPGYRRVGIRWR